MAGADDFDRCAAMASGSSWGRGRAARLLGLQHKHAYVHLAIDTSATILQYPDPWLF
jgi:hypothetical protein